VQNDLVSIILLPLTLAFIMFALGLGLALADFKRIFTQPRALLVGAVCHFLLLPLACHLMLDWWGISGRVCGGFHDSRRLPYRQHLQPADLSGARRCGAGIEFYRRGQRADHFHPAADRDLGAGPLSGRGARGGCAGGADDGASGAGAGCAGQPWHAGAAALAGWARRFESRATRIATLLFLLIVVLAVLKNFALVRSHIVSLAPFALTLNLGMLAIGFGMAWLARLSRSQAITLGIETAVQNAALALVIASSVLKDDAMAIPGALYGVTMYVGGLLFALTVRRFAPEPAYAVAPARD
jgi:BASS family bile acid:Na+ symporter